jgi:beta-aspartyl-dipeptidase (metallo-type)
LLTLLRNANVFAPEPLGQRDLLIANGAIEAIAPALAALPAGIAHDEMDLQGALLAPGLIDAHVHVTGGGGESGPSSRVPPISLGALARAGITTVVGVLGTDGTTRTVASLVARTLGLRDEGLSAWCYTGNYMVPVPTLTGSVRGDITFVDPIIGVGELALSDHRSSQPTLDELLRIAGDCHVSGLMTGKAGVLHLHLGDGKRGLGLVRQALATSEIPARVFWPTHVNRQRWLFEEALALARQGCVIDVTAFPSDEESWSAEEAIGRYLATDLPLERITCSSDGAGCLPTFDAEGRLVEMDIGRPAALTEALQALLRQGVPPERALAPFGSNVARHLRLARKGRVAVGCDADLLVLDKHFQVSDVMARGRFLVRGGVQKVFGTFEKRERA